ncbi:hypothetical protein JNUCC1_00886 [Lentibacillus sp. JNUCC-1]|nr:hypothetical protein [Lentibacillus sp. JNUCC-1]
MGVQDRFEKAQKELRRSVVRINNKVFHEVKEKNEDVQYFGVKDTDQIPAEIIEILRRHLEYALLTIDKGSDKGRAIDTDLINPITYRVMTGSSSGGPINILKGINDFAIGTDGGGSVLGPALSCHLPSVIGAGVGLLVKNHKTSTDGIHFKASIGIIGKKVSRLNNVMESVIGCGIGGLEDKKLKIIVPKKGSVTTPDKKDMHEKVMHVLSSINNASYIIEEMDMCGIEERSVAIETINKSFKEKQADMILTCEGPVDVYGYGETIPQFFGDTGIAITKHHGKCLIRAANMCQTTAMTVPINELASGMVIIAKPGIKHCGFAFDLAQKLEDAIHLPDIWNRYFLKPD